MAQYLHSILQHIYPLVGGAFSMVFLVIVLIVLIKALRTHDLRNLFTDNYDGHISVTKFWQNVAYSAATVAFLGVNMGSTSGFPIEVVWVIYLGVVASNAVLSKWISAKYAGPAEGSHYGTHQPPAYFPPYNPPPPQYIPGQTYSPQTGEVRGYTGEVDDPDQPSSP